MNHTLLGSFYAFWNEGCVGGESETLLGHWMQGGATVLKSFSQPKQVPSRLIQAEDLRIKKV
ncbi:hypothetical protein D3C76_1674830 [compost metagenome]